NPLVRAALASDILGDRLADEWEIFTTLKVPKYIIKGDQDPSVNPMYLDKVVQACSNTCELITIENCGHYPSLERPMEFNEILLRIIDDVI
ncbi:MAG TPA: alpha/beta hydrolase, partial [Chitinophagales bacterium]|nr:alpha/beta hydrolase [Chitinophagales bacterium]